MAKRGRPPKQQEAEQTAPQPAMDTGYSISKPGNEYVVKLGANVVYSTGLEADAQRYVEMASGKK